jgi:VWFA-related protein
MSAPRPIATIATIATIAKCATALAFLGVFTLSAASNADGADPTPSSESGAPPEPLVEKVGVVSVEIPVQVQVKSEPLRGLGRDNFEIFDGGKRQRITGFRTVDLALVNGGAVGDAPPDLPISGRRHFLLVFDLSFSERGSLLRAERHIREWVARALHPSDLVAVATFGVHTGARLLIPFTSDREQLDLAIASLGAPQLAERPSDPLGLGFGVERGSFLEATEQDSYLNGYDVAWDDDVVGAAQQDVFYGAFEPTQYAAQRFPVRQLTSEFGQLARLMRSVKGRKHVVYLSEGIDSALVFAADDVRDITSMNEAVQSGELWRVDSTKRFGSGPTRAVISAMLEEFRRADCVIQAVDIRGYEKIGTRRTLPGSTDLLGYMANETGGDVYRSYVNLNDALDRLLNVTSVTYLLSFSPDGLEPDGEFHKVKVKLRGVPKGARASHRPGYWAPLPYSERSEPERRLVVGELLLAGEEGGPIDTSVLATPYQSAEPGVRVPVLVEIDGVTLTLGGGDGERVPLEIYVYAFEAGGELRDFFNQSLTLDLAKVGPLIRSSGLKFFGELDLAPGRYSLRVLVLNRESGRSGMSVRQLDVPDLDSSGPLLLASLFPEPRGKWLLARESGLSKNPRSFPFLIADEPYLPAAAPTLPVRSTAPLHLLGYNLDDRVQAVGHVFAADGSQVKEIALTIRERAVRTDAGPDTLITTFNTSGLEAGVYTLVVTVLDPARHTEQSTSIPLLITRS